jgi:hypothetical protein
MRGGVLLYILGLGLAMLLARLGGGPEDIVTQASGVGWLAALIGLLLNLKAPTSDEGSAAAKRWIMICQLLGLVGLGLVTALTLDLIPIGDDGQVEVLAQVAAALLIGLSIVPLWTVERVRAASPVVLSPARVSEAGLGGLSLGLALALLFPVNHLASVHNVRWDHSYFKTASPGEVTLATIANLDEPIQAWLFFPTTSDVTQEVRTYFDQITHPNLEVQYVDQALEAELAKDLRIQKNGAIALVRGTGEDKQVQRIRLGDEISKAERKLKKLDKDVSKALLKLASDPRQAYITVGHGEMYWKKSGGVLPARTIEGMKSELKRLNFKVSELGAAQGLASEVPEDAELVLVMGPTEAFLEEELAALDAYRSLGGALWVAMDPGSKADLNPLLEPMGLAYDGSAMLVGSTNVWVATRRITDRYNIFTNKTSTHPSVTTLSRNSKTRALLTPLAAPLTVLESAPHKVEVTVRSLTEVWLDTTPNVRFDAAGEEKKGWPLSVAVTGGEGEKEFRTLVTGDATWASDLVLPLSMGNQEFLRDGLSWLVDEPSQAGTVNSEEDVKIRHTKGDDAWLFYGTTLVVPVVLLGFGLVRVRARRKDGE